jgi:transposase
MTAVKVEDFLECLDLIGEVWRSSDGSKPADPVVKFKVKLSNTSANTIGEWVSAARSAGTSVAAETRRRKTAQTLSEAELQVLLQQLEETAEKTGSREAFTQLDALKLSSPNWTKLARLAGIKKVTGIERVKLELRSHLAGRSQLKIREKNVEDVFG